MSDLREQQDNKYTRLDSLVGIKEGDASWTDIVCRFSEFYKLAHLVYALSYIQNFAIC